MDFAYFEKNYRLIAPDLSKQKALDPDSRAIQQTVFTGKIKSTVANTRVILYYNLEQSKETILQFSKGRTKVQQILLMNEYSTVNVKLTDTQLKKLKTDVKSKTGMTLRMSLKMIDRNDQRHELFVTTRQKTNLRNAFNNSLSTDLKLTKAQISEIIQSGGF